MTAKNSVSENINTFALSSRQQFRHQIRIPMAKRIICASVAASLLSGCSTIVAYSPKASGTNQQIRYTQGVGTLSVKDSDQEIFIYPTFRTQEMSGPTFTIGYANNAEVPVNFSTDNVKAFFRGEPVRIYTYTEKIDEIQSSKRTKQVALAILGAVAAGAAAYSASRTTYTNNYSGYVASRGHFTSFAGSNTVRVYDPMAGMFVGAAIGGATGLGVQQLEYNAQNQEQAAGSILQENTVDPQRMVMGNLILKDCCDPFTGPNDIVRFEVAVNGRVNVFDFIRGKGAGAPSPMQSSISEVGVTAPPKDQDIPGNQSEFSALVGQQFYLRYDYVGLYQEPKEGSARIQILRKENGVVVKEVKGDWLRVEVGDVESPWKKKDGWVAKNLVTLN